MNRPGRRKAEFRAAASGGGSELSVFRVLFRLGGLYLTLHPEEAAMGGIIYLVGLIVIILAILSFLGLR